MLTVAASAAHVLCYMFAFTDMSFAVDVELCAATHVLLPRRHVVFSLHLPRLGWLISLTYILLFGCTLRLRSWAQSLPPKVTKLFGQ